MNKDYDGPGSPNTALQTEVQPNTAAVTEQPSNVLVMPFYRTNQGKMYFFDNALVTHINNLFATYGEDEVLKALEFHYKLNRSQAV